MDAIFFCFMFVSVVFLDTGVAFVLQNGCILELAPVLIYLTKVDTSLIAIVIFISGFSAGFYISASFRRNSESQIYDEGYKDGYLTAVYNIEEELKKEAEQEQSNY